MGLVTTILMATLVVGAFYLTGALHLGPMATGLVMTIGPAIAAVTGIPAGQLVGRPGSPTIVVTGLVGVAIGSALMALLLGLFGVASYIARPIIWRSFHRRTPRLPPSPPRRPCPREALPRRLKSNAGRPPSTISPSKSVSASLSTARPQSVTARNWPRGSSSPPCARTPASRIWTCARRVALTAVSWRILIKQALFRNGGDLHGQPDHAVRRNRAARDGDLPVGKIRELWVNLYSVAGH